MAQPKPTRFDQRKIASAIQDTLGTPEVIDPALHGWRLYNGQSQLEVDFVDDNPDSPYFQGDDFAAANERGYIEGEARLTPPVQPGHATDGIPECDVWLRTAGFARTLNPLTRETIYTPVSEDFDTATHKFEQSDLLTELFDAQTSVQEIALEIGQKARATGVRMQGHVAEFDESDLGDVIVFEGTGPTMQKSNSRQRIVVNGGSPLATWAKKHGLQLNVAMTTEDWTEHGQTFIPRKPAWNIQIAKTALADLNPRTLRRDGAILGITTRLTGATGLYVELYTRGKLRDFTQADVNNNMHFTLSGPTRVGAGDDDCYIKFGDATFRLNGTLAAGVEEAVYAASGLTPSGDFTGPLTWTVHVGPLPTGLSIASATGLITGTPAAASAGSYPVTIRATDSSDPAKVADLQVTIVVTAP